MKSVRLLLGAVSLIATGAIQAGALEPSHIDVVREVVYTTGHAPHDDKGALPSTPVVVAGRPVVEVPIDRGDGGLWVEALINGRVTARMLVDTGSSVVILPPDVADELGLGQDDGHQRRLNTIQGTVTGRLVTLDQVQLGSARVRSVTAVILQDAQGDTIGLLGRSFLEHFTFQVDLDRNVLTLIPRASSRDVAVDAEDRLERAAEKRMESLQAEQARAWMDGKASPEYLEYLRRSVDYWAAQRARYN